MGGLPDGEYTLKVAAGRQPLAGVDFSKSGLVLPVITDGDDNVFTLTRLQDGNYTFVLKKEKDGFPRTVYIHDDEGDLVGKDTQPPSAWTITGPDTKGLSTIQVPRDVSIPGLPFKGWTVKNTEPNQPVTLNDLGVSSQDNQLWQISSFPG